MNKIYVVLDNENNEIFGIYQSKEIARKKFLIIFIMIVPFPIKI